MQEDDGHGNGGVKVGWLKIDDEFEDHEKTEQLSDAAHRLWFRCACWCRKRENQRTGGAVPERVVVRFCGGARAKAIKLADELVSARGEEFYGHEHGLWEQIEGGWRFHDWDEYQPSSCDDGERKREIREKRAEAGRRGGRRSVESRLEASGSAQPCLLRSKTEALASKQIKQPRSPLPDPLPDPDLPVTVAAEDLEPPTRAEANPGTAARKQRVASVSDPWRSRAPSSLDEALTWPLEARARSCLEHDGEWSCPQQWPEVVGVHEALARSMGRSPGRLGSIRRDSGVKAVVGLYADGVTEPELLEAVGNAERDGWWRTGRKGLASLTPEVVRRLLEGGVRAAEPESAADMLKRAAERRRAAANG